MTPQTAIADDSGPSLAVVTPLPPSQTGIAAYSARLLDAMSAHCTVHAYADGRDGEPVGGGSRRLQIHPLGELPATEAPQRLYCFGNSPFHVGAWQALRAFGGDALLHEVALWGLYLGLDQRGLLGAGGIGTRVHELEGCSLEAVIPAPCSMVAEIVSSARRIFVHTEAAGRLLAERHPDRAGDICVVSFALPPPSPAAPPSGPPVVASFGHQRAAALVIEAFGAIAAAIPSVRLWLVGAEHFPGQIDPLLADLRARGLDERVTFTGWVDETEYWQRIHATTVAIQPRTLAYGERSAALGDLLSAGVPTVVNDRGQADALTSDAVILARDEAGPSEMARGVIALLSDGAQRARTSAAALSYARNHGAARAAAELYAAICA